MNTWRWTVALVAGGALVAACTTTTPSDDETTDGDGGSGGTTGPSTGPGPGSTTGPTTTAATMMGGGICDSGLFSPSAGEDACLTASCCDSFNACAGDTDCNNCLTNAMAPGCDTNGLLTTFNACADANCQTNVCDDGVTFNDADMNPAFACISCANDTSATACGFLDTCTTNGMNTTTIQACLDCLNDPAVDPPDFATAPMAPTSGTCFNHGATIYDAAVGFETALRADCATPCYGQ